MMSEPYTSPTEQQTPRDRRATAALVLGIVGMVAWIIPATGFPVTIIGLIFGIQGLSTERRKTAMAGMILSIIGLVLTIINSAIGAYLGATGQHPLLR